MGKPDYSRCSLDELLDVKQHINRERYPERYADLLRHIELIESGQAPEKRLDHCAICNCTLEKRAEKRKFGIGKYLVADSAGCLTEAVVFAIFAGASTGCFFYFPWQASLAIHLSVLFLVLFLLTRDKQYYICPTCKEVYSVAEVET